MNTNIIWMIIVLAILTVLLSVINQLRSDLTYIKSTLDMIAKKAGITDIITDDVKNELRSLISEGKTVEAVKKYRMITGAGLKESKEYIDNLSNI